MLLSSDTYVLQNKDNRHYKTVTRAEFSNSHTEIHLDYHSDLLKINEGDNVKIDIYCNELPKIDKSIYSMRGVLYSIEEGEFRVSFGGLQLIYKGELKSKLETELEIYITVQVI